MCLGIHAVVLQRQKPGRAAAELIGFQYAGRDQIPARLLLVTRFLMGPQEGGLLSKAAVAN